MSEIQSPSERLRSHAPSQVARHIATAAAKLFASQGYDATSVRSIVDAAGVTKPTLYYHFGSKEGLANALLTRPFNDLLATLTSILTNDQPPVDQLKALFEAKFAFCREDPDRARFVYALLFGPLGAGLAGEVERLGKGIDQAMLGAARRLAGAGLIAPEQVDAFTAACRGMVVVSTVDFLYKGQILAPGLADRLVHQLLRGFSTGEPCETAKEPIQ